MTLTGFGWFFSATHQSRDGKLHGHTWEVTAWSVARIDAEQAQAALRTVLAELDHAMLPPDLAWGEDIAAWIAGKLACAGIAPVRIDVSRPAERIYARWLKDAPTQG